MPAVPRFDKNGRQIPPGPPFGRRLPAVEDDRKEALTPEEGPWEQTDAGEAVQAVLEDVQQRREELGVQEDAMLEPEHAQDFVSRAIAATAYASGKVVEANDTQAPSLEAQHREHLMRAYSGDLPEDDEQALYEEGLGVDPDAAEHARLLAELEADDEEEVADGYYTTDYVSEDAG
jgi:hypothetical protein